MTLRITWEFPVCQLFKLILLKVCCCCYCMSDVKLLCVSWWNVVNIVWGERIEIKFKSSITGTPTHLKNFHSNAKFEMLKYSELPMIIESYISRFNFETGEWCNFHFQVWKIFQNTSEFHRSEGTFILNKIEIYNFSLWYFIGNLLLNKHHFMLHTTQYLQEPEPSLKRPI